MKKIKVKYNIFNDLSQLCDYLERMSNDFEVIDFQVLDKNSQDFNGYKLIIRYVTNW